MFVHYGLYAVTGRFTGIRWVKEGANPLYSGSMEPVEARLFDPVDFDAERWASAARAGGARYLLFTAKHHDGFCLWPTSSSPYSVRASPWRGGRGDCVGELARASSAAGLRFGFYLSPWDAYAFHTLRLTDAEYDRYYLAQLEELLTGYGDIAEVWWDGAGAAFRRHDWLAYYEKVKRLQPDAVVMGAGSSDVRWIWEVPEEQGLAVDPNRYVVHIPELTPGEPKRPGGLSLWPADLPGGDYWWPGESYLAMDRFWSGRTGLGFEEHLRTDTSSSVDDVVAAWHRTVGHGVNLVVNFVPRPRGDLPPLEVERFARAGEILCSTYETNLALGARALAGSAATGHGPEMAVDGSPATWWEASGGTGDAWIEVSLGRPMRLDRIVLGEALQRGQNVESFRVLRRDGSGWQPLAEGLTIGHKRIARFPPVTATGIRVELSSGGSPVALRNLGLYLGAGRDGPGDHSAS